MLLHIQLQFMIYAFILTGGKSFGKSTNSDPKRNIPFAVTPIILPQNNMNNRFSVLYSCGNVTDAKNIITANPNTDGN